MKKSNGKPRPYRYPTLTDKQIFLTTSAEPEAIELVLIIKNRYYIKFYFISLLGKLMDSVFCIFHIYDQHDKVFLLLVTFDSLKACNVS